MEEEPGPDPLPLGPEAVRGPEPLEGSGAPRYRFIAAPREVAVQREPGGPLKSRTATSVTALKRGRVCLAQSPPPPLLLRADLNSILQMFTGLPVWLSF